MPTTRRGVTGGLCDGRQMAWGACLICGATTHADPAEMEDHWKDKKKTKKTKTKKTKTKKGKQPTCWEVGPRLSQPMRGYNKR